MIGRTPIRTPTINYARSGGIVPIGMKSWRVSKLLVSEAGANRLQLLPVAEAFLGGGVFKRWRYQILCEIHCSL